MDNHVHTFVKVIVCWQASYEGVIRWRVLDFVGGERFGGWRDIHCHTKIPEILAGKTYVNKLSN